MSWARNLTAVLKCLQQIRKMSTYNFRHADPAVTEVQNALHLAESSGAAPELIEKLKSALDLVKLRDDFALAATSKESTKLREIFEETHRHDWAAVHKQGKLSRTLSPWMCSGHLEGKNFFFLSCVWCSVYDSMAMCWKLPQLFFFCIWCSVYNSMLSATSHFDSMILATKYLIHVEKTWPILSVNSQFICDVSNHNLFAS